MEGVDCGPAPFMMPDWPDAPQSTTQSPLFRFASTDMDAVRDRMCRIFRPHAIRPKERVRDPRRFELDEIPVGSDLVLTRVRYNRAVTIEAPPLDEFFVMQFTLTGTCETRQGRVTTQVRPGQLCVLNATRPIYQDMDSSFGQMAVKISRSLLERQLAAELGRGLPHLLEFLPEAVPLTGPRASLARTIAMLWDDLIQGRTGFSAGVVQRAIQQTVAALLLTAVPHNFSERLMRSSGTPAPHFVRKAEEFIHDHAALPITLSDIVEASGVSQRSLQTGFRQFRATTPMAYLKTVRLDRARRALLDSRHTGQTVTQIALESGFSHLSKFAQDYKARFGETPSATARQGG